MDPVIICNLPLNIASCILRILLPTTQADNILPELCEDLLTKLGHLQLPASSYCMQGVDGQQ